MLSYPACDKNGTTQIFPRALCLKKEGELAGELGRHSRRSDKIFVSSLPNNVYHFAMLCTPTRFVAVHGHTGQRQAVCGYVEELSPSVRQGLATTLKFAPGEAVC